MPDELKWNGWELRGTLVLAPRRVRLTREEALVLAFLMNLRLQHQNSWKRFAVPERLQKVIGGGSLNAVRVVINKLRAALGKNAIETHYGKGYVLIGATERRGTTTSPIDDLVTDLERLLSEARRLQQSIKEGLYHES